MSDINTGGQAFPCLERGGNGLELTDGGMTLRDYFAAKAMQGFLTQPGSINANDEAEFAYKIADAMLKARKK